MNQLLAEFAVCGALSSATGEKGIIASTQAIRDDSFLYKSVNDLDRKLFEIQRNSPDSASIQYYLLKINSGETKFKTLLIRAKKRFTIFETRQYARRELFYAQTESLGALVNLFSALPPMQNFEKDHYGKLSPIPFSAEHRKNQPDAGILEKLLYSFLHQRPLVLSLASSPELVLDTLSYLPLTYQTRIQIGFNLSPDDELALTQLHLFTVAVDIPFVEQPQPFNDRIISNMVREISYGNTQRWDQLSGEELSDDHPSIVYKLFRKHYLVTLCETLSADPSVRATISNDMVADIRNELSKAVSQRDPGSSGLFLRTLISLGYMDDTSFQPVLKLMLTSSKFGKFLDDKVISSYARDFLQSRIRYETTFSGASNNLRMFLSDADGTIAARLIKDILGAYLQAKRNLTLQDFLDAVEFFSENQELDSRLSSKELLLKVDMESALVNASDQQLKTLFSSEIMEAMNSSAITALVDHVGITNLKKYIPVRNILKRGYVQLREIVLRQIESRGFQDHASIYSHVELMVRIADKTELRDFSKRLSLHFRGLIHEGGNRSALISYLDIIREHGQDFVEDLPALLRELFVERIDSPVHLDIIKKIAETADQLKIEIDLRGIVIEDLHHLNNIISILKQYPDVFKKGQVKRLRQDFLGSTKAAYRHHDFADLVQISILENDGLSTDKDERVTLLMIRFREEAQKGSFTDLENSLEQLLRELSGDKFFWIEFFKSELPEVVFKMYMQEKFRPSVFKQLGRALDRMEGKEYNMTLKQFLESLDSNLYQKHFARQNSIIRVMHTIQLISKKGIKALYIVSAIAILFIFLFINKGRSKAKSGADDNALKSLREDHERLLDSIRLNKPTLRRLSADTVIDIDPYSLDTTKFKKIK
ncbi:MAG: hypothetical protein JNK27_11800 [Chitinophagaceae bacterium]|nr:hypothetical protein [Chitinophagaceae bacterium]